MMLTACFWVIISDMSKRFGLQVLPQMMIDESTTIMIVDNTAKPVFNLDIFITLINFKIIKNDCRIIVD
jgi:hypothetical protein